MSASISKTENPFLQFPSSFLWGAATSHFQIEGHPFEITSRASDWSQWCMEAGRISDNTTADTACEFYTRYIDDVELCRKLNLNAFRLSLNWPALLPEAPTNGNVRLDPETVAFYRAVLSRLKRDKIKTFVTLFHFTLPLRLAKAGGWNSSVTVDEFVRFALLAAEEFGDLVDYWITLNEPLAYAYQGYVSGLWPPGERGNFVGAFRCVRHMLEGHSRAHEILHKQNADAKVSFTMHWRPFVPKRQWSPLDRMTQFYRDYVFNQMFPLAVQTGKLDFPFPLNLHADVRALIGPIKGLKGTMDYLALNYYTRELCQFDFSKPDLFGSQSLEHEFEVNCMGWENYPDGLYNTLTQDLIPYKFNTDGSEREIIITENGYASEFSAELDEGDWSLVDDVRIQYLTTHLQAVHRAIQKGANVKGYLYWSLLDNFEWAEGLRPRFGLVRVAYPTQVRTLRKSAEIYSEIAKKNGLQMQRI